MEKQITLSTSNNMMNKFNDMVCCVTGMADAVRYALAAPLRLLGRYYSAVLEQPIDMRISAALTTTQLAFFLTIMPADYPLAVRCVACAWFVASLRKCRKML